MARGRRAEDWRRDLESARPREIELGRILATDPRVAEFEDHTRSFDRLDYSFTYRGARVHLDLKEKIRATSRGLASLWPEVAPRDLFVIDETVYRRIVWQGGGGYLAVHDHPGERWLIFGPWELTLGPRRRYTRWGERGSGAFPKGKVLLDLTTAAAAAAEFSVDLLLQVVERSRAQRDEVGAVAILGQTLPEIGSPGPQR
ncbi:MAG: hypothetical protein ABR505_04565 [Actinomycetota bacterium]